MHRSAKNVFYFIFGLFGLLFIATFVTVRLSLKNHEGVMDKDYYEKGLNYEKVIGETREMLALGYGFSGEIFENRKFLHTGKNKIRISFTKNNSEIPNASVSMIIERGATSKLTAKHELAREGNHFIGEVELPSYGGWLFTFYGRDGKRTLQKTFQVIVSE